MSVPLYKQLQAHPYPSHQCLDRESVLWLIEQGKPRSVDIHSILPAYSPFPINELDLQVKWFADTKLSCGIHGVRHLVRVALYAWIITQFLEMNSPSERAGVVDFLQAAMVHDIRRLDDNADIEHGHRSAEWAEATLPNISDAAIAAVRFHNEEAPVNLDTHSLKLLQILKTADALDRFRLPKVKWWLDKERTPLAVNDELLEFCKYVTLQTELETCDIEGANAIIKKLEIWLKQEALI